MKLDIDFVKEILIAFQEHDDTYMPVALLAKKINDNDNLVGVEDLSEVSKYSLSGKLVFHLLHCKPAAKDRIYVKRKP